MVLLHFSPLRVIEMWQVCNVFMPISLENIELPYWRFFQKDVSHKIQIYKI